MVTIGLTKAHCGQCPGACAGRDEAPGQGRGTGFLQETAFDLDLGEWVKHAQVKVGVEGTYWNLKCGFLVSQLERASPGS